jgi:hypothetical protein
MIAVAREATKLSLSVDQKTASFAAENCRSRRAGYDFDVAWYIRKVPT